MSLDFDEINLTSQQILERISEQSIYEYFLNTKVSSSKLVKCCFHKDSNPSLGFYKSSSDKLVYKCFGCGAQGGIFDFVKNLHNCGFGKALNIIQNTFKLSKNDYNQRVGVSGKDNTVTERFNILEGSDFEFKKTVIISTFRNWNKIDLDYWNQFNISFNLLDYYNVRPCSKVHIVQKSGDYLLFAEHSKTNPIYYYKVSNSCKIYRPYNPKKGKWANNCDNFDIQGLEQLPEKGELLIITSSLKDVMVLNVMGYNAIALGGEGNNIPNSILDFLWASFDNIIVFYDNDKAGIEYGIKLSEQIGAGNIYIPVKYKEKDISDFVKSYTFDKGVNLIKQLI